MKTKSYLPVALLALIVCSIAVMNSCKEDDKNEPPTISFLELVDGATISRDSTITLQVDASDPDGTIAKVEFYVAGSKVATVTEAPFEFLFDPSAFSDGGFTIKAIAFDNEGLDASTELSITFVSNSLPIVKITNPINDTTYRGRHSLYIEVDASDADGTVEKVDFYFNGQFIDTDDYAPYKKLLYYPATEGLGENTVKAIAYDDAGGFASDSISFVQEYDTIFPHPYLAVYPGSSWTYSDGHVEYTEPDYVLKDSEFEIPAPAFVPFKKGENHWNHFFGDHCTGYGFGAFGTNCEYFQVLDTIINSSDYCYGSQAHYAVRIVKAVDTTIQFANSVFDSVIVVKTYTGGPSYPEWLPDSVYGKEFYAKHIGLVGKTSFNYINDEEEVIDFYLTDYFINKD